MLTTRSFHAIRREKTMNRRTFLSRTAALGGMSVLGPLHALGVRAAYGKTPPRVAGYGPLAPKGPELALPAGFNYQVISRQGEPMRDGFPTPGAFDGMGAFPGRGGTTILIRNHENRERLGEVPVVTTAPYDPTVRGGNSKLVVRRRRSTRSGLDGEPLYDYVVEDSFAILGGTSTNCAGGELPFRRWITCEEVVKGPAFGPAPGGPSALKHGYIFEIDATADTAVPAVPIVAAGRFHHEAVAWVAGVLYQTEDRNISTQGGACFYRYLPRRRFGPDRNLVSATGVLQALKLKDEFAANMNGGRPIGAAYSVEWVTIDEPDHDDDTDNRRDRVSGFTPVRFQAQDKGAAVFDRQEGMWASGSKVYFDCTEGGALRLGQVWEYDAARETLTLIYESTTPDFLKHPDNIAIVPQTGDMLLCEDSSILPQYIRGLTPDGEIYDFAQALIGETEFAGACFAPDGRTLFVNQYGQRSATDTAPDLPFGPPNQGGVTYAIYGPFQGRRGRHRTR
jgi:secreted PhoX family phosphatase